jgi:hypothetical protein
MIAALRTVIKRMHYPLEVMLTCVRWYVSYPLSFRHLEEMMEERGVADARVQGLSLRPHPRCRHRNDAHDPQGADQLP